MLAVSIMCLFTTLIWIVVVAIFVALVLWLISYLGGEVPVPALVGKLIVVLGVIIAIWLIVTCLISGHPAIMAP